MSEELLINVTPQETRVALIENGVLQEISIERSRNLGIVGNVYKGRVARVLPGMEAAFIDIGLERAAFLHVSDIASPPPRDADGKPATGRTPNGRPAGDGNGEERSLPIVQDVLREGQELLVQVIKDPLGSKGARLTTHLTTASRYLVLMPNDFNLGVSSKIEDEDERDRLRSILEPRLQETNGWGYIVRTAAEGVGEAALLRDMAFLNQLWHAVQNKARRASAGDIVHEDQPLVLRTLRDLVDGGVEKIRVDSRLTFQRMCEFAREFTPEVMERIEHYAGERPIFEIYGVEDEIIKALQPKVQLKSGGYVIIDQTEAMTTIDVNTGAFVGHRTLEETIFKTNLEAAQSIARQLRVRNLGGIIIIDFIDMLQEEHKRQVLRALEKALDRDHAKSQVCDVSSLGLVEMTRKRTRESLEHTLCEACPTCGGRGSVKTPETVCYEIFREILREAREFDARELRVFASQPVVDILLDEESTSLAELEEFIGIPIRLQLESMYGQEQYDVVIV
ncbi:MAG: ribonuclease G [Gammaproteobacteria bacterium]|nr:ribonuclease G [Gammaproteobacteria bacterium]